MFNLSRLRTVRVIVGYRDWEEFVRLSPINGEFDAGKSASSSTLISSPTQKIAEPTATTYVSCKMSHSHATKMFKLALQRNKPSATNNRRSMTNMHDTTAGRTF
uniref:Uncharacterized protein n=1 Tax=Lotharella oceanica TaxID=641309 RepID=A0A7S2TJI1_9EUKA|mmetsp:Transcript_16708/g.31691  ORF Transcript_16708/g.31691 Transcript_16708/m.31691 type:complete len:104 (+) Transcript_16708:460-771(+)